MNDGTKLTLVGVTYGKHHVAPKVKMAGGRARTGGTRVDSANNTVVVWIEAEHKANQYPNYQLMVYDTANTACVSAWSRTQSQIKNGVEMQGFMLNAYPRWDSKMILRVIQGTIRRFQSRARLVSEMDARPAARHAIRRRSKRHIDTPGW